MDFIIQPLGDKVFSDISWILNNFTRYPEYHLNSLLAGKVLSGLYLALQSELYVRDQAVRMTRLWSRYSWMHRSTQDDPIYFAVVVCANILGSGDCIFLYDWRDQLGRSSPKTMGCFR